MTQMPFMSDDNTDYSKYSLRIKVPVYKWKFRYIKDDNITYMKEVAPNLFHRAMQRLVLGVIWERIE